MRDVQNDRDKRNIPVDMVGVRSVMYPIVVLDKENQHQDTVGSFNIYVDLPKDFRGTHMSRFIEVLDSHNKKITPRNMKHILDDILNSLDAAVAHLKVEFPYFIRKQAPISRIESYSSYRCSFTATKNDHFDFVLGVSVPVMTVCPCSREISDRGAHNQRAEAHVQLRMSGLVWIEDVVQIVEDSASSPVFSLLKREDEKFVTERSYDNPRFVEDLSREIVQKLETDERISWYKVEVTSMESIHNHEAYACIERKDD
jgi:GTP cyclohydrolase I